MHFSLSEWFAACEHAAARSLKSPAAFLEPLVVNAAVRALFLDVEVRALLQQWWDEAVPPAISEEHRAVLDEVFRFEPSTLPLTPGETPDQAREDEDGVVTYVRRETFGVDVPALVSALAEQLDSTPAPSGETTVELSWRTGVEDYVDNHEEAILFRATVVPV